MKNKAQVGFWTIVSLVSGNLLGAGVFLLPVTLAAFGSISLLGWMISSIGAIFLALVFAKLGATTTRSGGPHVYIGEAFGQKASFYVAWSYWIFSWISNAALITAAVGYIGTLYNGLSFWQTFSLEGMILIIFIMINLWGIHAAGAVKVIFTGFKLLILLIVPLVGMFKIQSVNFEPFNATEHSVIKTLMLVIFTTVWGFIGLETGTVPSAEIAKPNKTIPQGTIVGTSISALVYLLGTIAIIGAIPRGQLLQSTAPYADLVNVVFGGNWHKGLAVVAILSILSTYNGWLLVVSRIAYGAAIDGLFPKIFSKTLKNGSPYISVLVSSLCTAFIVLLTLLLTLKEGLIHQFNYIVDISVTIILLIYLLCVCAYIKTIVINKKLNLWNIIIALGALSFNLLMIIVADFKMLLLSLLVALSGIPMYYYIRKAKN